MSQPDPGPPDSQQNASLATPDDINKRVRAAFETLAEGITPWLVEMGSWLFGGLIAFNLIVVAALITVGPVDPAILVATVAFALALPAEVAGLFLLRLDQDLKHVGFEEEVAQAFQEVPFPGSEQVTSPTLYEARRKQRTRSVLLYCMGILTLGVVLTLTGMMAALWHMAWWIGIVFFVMVLASLVVVIIAISASQSYRPAKKK
jgi:hypothetical protein